MGEIQTGSRLRESVKLVENIAIPSSEQFEEFLQRNGLILDERELSIPPTWRFSVKTPFMGNGPGVSDYCIVYDGKNRDRLIIWPDRVEVYSRFCVIGPTVNVEKGKQDRMRIAVYDRKMVESINQFDGMPNNKIVFELKERVPNSFSEQEKENMKEDFTKAARFFLKQNYPDYRNPYSYWD